MSKPVLVAAAITCAVAAVLFARFLHAGHDLVASTPSPRAVFEVSLIDIPAGKRLCIGDVTIPHDARQIRFQVKTYGVPGPPLNVELEGGSYRATVPVPGGYPDGGLIAERMPPPPADVLGQVCLRNTTDRGFSLIGTAEERTLSRPEGEVDGRVQPADAYLAFYEARQAGALRVLPDVIERMSAFRPGIVGPWLLWTLLVLTAIGVPLGLLWALLNAVRA
jgi:hypothetical protein